MTGRRALPAVAVWMVLLMSGVLDSAAVAAPVVRNAVPVQATTAAPPAKRPVAGTVTITTVPPVPSVRLRLDGAEGVTDDSGRVVLQSANLDKVASRVSLASHEAGEVHVNLVRAAPVRSTRPRTRQVRVALAVRQPVDLRFVDGRGRPVDPARVDRVVLRSRLASAAPIEPSITGPTFLLAKRSGIVGGQVSTVSVTYAVDSVRVDGAEAVFAAQQRFDPSISRIWTIRLQVFDLRVEVRDAFFGGPTGDVVVVRGPSGDERQLRLDAAGRAALPSTVRGSYEVEVRPSGLSSTQAVVVSRDDTLQLRVVSRKDLLVVGAGVVALLVALLAIGRRLRRRAAARRLR